MVAFTFARCRRRSVELAASALKHRKNRRIYYLKHQLRVHSLPQLTFTAHSVKPHSVKLTLLLTNPVPYGTTA